MKKYIAIPYSKIDREYSFKIANKVSAEEINKGNIIFSPISMNHHIAKDHNLPKDWLFWQKFDTEFIKWCDEMIVIMIDGWKESTGVQTEISLAKKFNKPINYIMR